MGEPAQWTCTAEGSLVWRTHPNGIRSPFYRGPHAYRLSEFHLGTIGPIMTKVTCVNGTEYVSVARVYRMESSLDGTKLWCAGSDKAFGAPEATVNLTVTGNNAAGLVRHINLIGSPEKKQIIYINKLCYNHI